MMTIDDIERLTKVDNLKKHRLNNLAKACENSTTDDMKTMWYKKMMKLAEQYDMKEYVMNRLVH